MCVCMCVCVICPALMYCGVNISQRKYWKWAW